MWTSSILWSLLGPRSSLSQHLYLEIFLKHRGVHPPNRMRLATGCVRTMGMIHSRRDGRQPVFEGAVGVHIRSRNAARLENDVREIKIPHPERTAFPRGRVETIERTQHQHGMTTHQHRVRRKTTLTRVGVGLPKSSVRQPNMGSNLLPVLSTSYLGSNHAPSKLMWSPGHNLSPPSFDNA